jgi:hypothetical protein
LLLLQSSEFLSLTPTSDADVCEAFQMLKPSKSVGLDYIHGFVIRCYSGVFIPVLRHIFTSNLSLTQQYFPVVWQEAAIIPVFEKGNHAAVNNYRPIPILSNFSKFLEPIIQDHVLY